MKKKKCLFPLLLVLLLLCACGAKETLSFAFTGGSGRVEISCGGMEEKDGQSVATVVFSSPNYSYVELDSVQYLPIEGAEGGTTFALPLTLNGATAIRAETLAMGSPHVVEYTLYLYTDGSDAAAAAGKRG